MGKVLKFGLVGYGLHAGGTLTELKDHPILKNRTKLIGGFDPDPNTRVKFEKAREG